MRRALVLVIATMFCTSGWAHTSEKKGAGGHERELANIITVASDGAHFETLTEALDYLATVSPPPDEDNRYVVRIGPGIYEGPVEMMEWVNIEGSGREVTLLTADGADEYLLSHTVLGANNAELSRMTVESTGFGRGYAVGIRCDNTSPMLRDLRVVAIGSGTLSRGIYALRSDVELDDVIVEAINAPVVDAFRSNYGAPSLTRVEARALLGTDQAIGVSIGFGSDVVRIVDSRIQAGEGMGNAAIGVQLDRSAGLLLDRVEVEASAITYSWALSLLNALDVVVKNSTLTAGGGGPLGYAVFDHGSEPAIPARRITYSTLNGDRASIFIQNDNVFHIGASQLSGPVTSYMGGSARCVASFDQMFAPLTAACASTSPPSPTPTPLPPTLTPTPPIPTPTPTPLPPTLTPTPPIPTPTPTQTGPTPTPTPTWPIPPTPTQTHTLTPTWTFSPTMTPTWTMTPTPTPP